MNTDSSQKFSAIVQQDSAVKSQLIFCGIIFVLAFLLYWPVRNAGYVFDDTKLILQNTSLWEGQGYDFNLANEYEHSEVRSNFRVLRFVSYQVDVWLTTTFFDYKPQMQQLGSSDVYRLKVEPPSFFFHLQSVFWHALNAILIFLLARKLFSKLNPMAAFAIAAAFLVHPIQTESVAYISGRRDVLFAFFYLSALLVYCHNRENRSILGWLGVGVLYVAALFTKEMAITLPAAIVFIEFLHRDQKPLLKRIPYVLLGILSIVALVFIWYLLNRQNPGEGTPYWGGSLLTAVLSTSRAIFVYLKLLVWPSSQTVDYSFAAMLPSTSLFSHFSHWIALGLLAIALACAHCAFHAARNKEEAGAQEPKLASNRVWSLGILSFLVLLLPVAQLIPHPERMAEHHLYLPCIGFFMLCAGLLARFASKVLPAASLGVGLLLVVWFIATSQRLNDWQDSLHLWKSASQTYPNCARAQVAYGNASLEAARIAAPQQAVSLFLNAQEAVTKAQEILEVLPKRDSVQQGYYLEAIELRAGLCASSGKPEELQQALNLYELFLTELQSSQGDKGVSFVYQEIFKLQLRLSKLKEAEIMAKKIIDTKAATLAEQLNASLYLAGRAAEAGDAAKASLVLDRIESRCETDSQKARIYYERGEHLKRQKLWQKALEKYKEAERLMGKHGRVESAIFQQAQCYERMKKFSAAAQRLEYLLEIRPHYLQGKLALGELYLANNKLSSARHLFEQVRIDSPNEGRAISGLQRIKLLEAAKENPPQKKKAEPTAAIMQRLAQNMESEGKFDAAYRAIKKGQALLKEGEDAIRKDLRFQLARVYEKQGLLKEAVQAYKDYIQIVPLSDQLVPVSLATKILHKESKYKELLLLLEERWQAGLRYPDFAQNIAHTALKLKDYEKAVLYLEYYLDERDLSEAKRQLTQQRIDSIRKLLEQENKKKAQ